MYQVPGFCFSATAPAAMEEKYIFVQMTSDGIEAATSDTDIIVGVLQRTGIAGEVLPVMHDGIAMVIASAAIAKGATVTATTNGYAVTSTGEYVGVAMEAATAAGDIIPVLLQGGGTAEAEEE